MLEYISGTLFSASPHKIVVEVNGLGYGLFIALSTFERLPQMGTKIRVFVSEVIREDSHRLFGFLTAQERDFFENLNQISGIGPRLSIALLGHMSLDELHTAAEHGNVKAISSVPGIGKKMAERLILELGDKFKKFDKQNISFTNSTVSDAINALIHLGYNALDAQKSVEKALATQKNDPPLSELISLALKAKK